MLLIDVGVLSIFELFITAQKVSIRLSSCVTKMETLVAKLLEATAILIAFKHVPSKGTLLDLVYAPTGSFSLLKNFGRIPIGLLTKLQLVLAIDLIISIFHALEIVWRCRKQLVLEFEAAFSCFQIDALLLVAINVTVHALENTGRAHISEELHF